MDGVQLSAATTGLMAKLTVISGWRIPDSAGVENYQKIFNDQLTKFVYETAGSMNLPELEYAVRRYGVDTSDWGKPMHLGLLSSCITSYLAEREIVSEIEERQSKTPTKSIKEAKETVLIPGPVDWTSEWDKVLYAAKIGQISNCWITTDLYDWLVRCGKIVTPDPTDLDAVERDRSDKWEIIKQCAAGYLQEIKDRLLAGTTVDPIYETKRRISVFENPHRPIWKRDTAIMSTLKVLAKIETVRQFAIFESLNQE